MSAAPSIYSAVNIESAYRSALVCARGSDLLLLLLRLLRSLLRVSVLLLLRLGDLEILHLAIGGAGFGHCGLCGRQDSLQYLNSEEESRQRKKSSYEYKKNSAMVGVSQYPRDSCSLKQCHCLFMGSILVG